MAAAAATITYLLFPNEIDAVAGTLFAKGRTEPKPYDAEGNREKIDNLEEQANDRSLDGARKQLAGEEHGRKEDGSEFDHVGKVEDALRGFQKRQRHIRDVVNSGLTEEGRREAWRDLARDLARIGERIKKIEKVLGP